MVVVGIHDVSQKLDVLIVSFKPLSLVALNFIFDMLIVELKTVFQNILNLLFNLLLRFLQLGDTSSDFALNDSQLLQLLWIEAFR